MNIFKTLASGSGSINEPNVSAFLGYLLNPKEDHGLGDAFLKKFLEPLLGNDDLDFLRTGTEIRNLSIHSNFEFEVLLEQAFKNDNKRNRIVDIVILCYEKKSQKGMFLAENIIQQKKEGVGNPKHIFLIENKISDDSCTVGQLNEQYERTIKKLNDWKIDTPENLVSVIFVTPDGKKCKEEFSEFNNTHNKKGIHLFWNKDDDSNSISEIIRDIIEKESKPIDAYCKYTLQAFLEFIENGFKSTIIEELEEKKRENPRFEYKGQIYTRPKLAKKIISNYIHDNPNITFDELSELFSEKMDREDPPFVKAEEAKDKGSFRKKDGSKIRDYFWYYKDSILIANSEEICIRNGWTDDELQELLKTFKINPNDVKRIK